MMFLFIFFGLLSLFLGCIIAGIKTKKCEYKIAILLASCCLFIIVLIGGTSAFSKLISDVNKANTINAKIQLMQPSSIDEVNAKITEEQLKSVQDLIQKAFDKYQIQATTYDLKGIKMYANAFSVINISGLGDIERGAGQKLKNLEALILKQEELAKQIIALKIKTYKPEFYELNQELHVLKNSAFDGIIVRWFLKDNIQPIKNTDYYANGVNIK